MLLAVYYICTYFPTSKSLPTSKRGCEDLQPHIERCQSTFSKNLNEAKKTIKVQINSILHADFIKKAKI